MYLPLANILHHRLRSVLSALGIGVGICMLITLSGLASGSLYEISDRWESVRADLIAFPRGLRDNITTMFGPVMGVATYRERLQAAAPEMVQDVVPVLLAQLKLGGQDQTVAGVDASQWPLLTGGRQVSQGRLYQPRLAWADFKRAIHARRAAAIAPASEPAVETPPTPEELAEFGWLDLVIDERLAHKGHYQVGDKVEAAGHRWTIAGVVPTGGMTRVYAPREGLQDLFADEGKCTLMFVRLKPGVDVNEASRKLLRVTDVMQVRQYRDSLRDKFGIMFAYIDAVNVIALAIAFLFIMITLYTMVLQRTREIAILKSFGATDAFVVRQVLAESLILAGAGTAVGIGGSLLAAWLIPKFTLLSVTITPAWLGIGVGAAAAGAIVAGLYPAWRATRVDMVEALTLE